MSGKVDLRTKQIRTFFWIARQIGEENARAVVRRLYNTESLKELTIDELKRVVDELIAASKITPRKPKREKAAAEAGPRADGGRFAQLPTRDQLQMIDDLANKMEIGQERLQRMIRKAGGGEPALNVMSARTLIEALKSMHARGWMDPDAAARTIDPRAAAARMAN